MNTLRNKVTLIGNAGMKPEVKHIENGSKLARFPLATNERYTNKQGEAVTQTQWHSIVAWGKIAGIIERYVDKGLEIMIEGKIQHRTVELASGERRYYTEIEASNVTLMDKSVLRQSA
jgi:single-strand DNA-binding protein